MDYSQKVSRDVSLISRDGKYVQLEEKIDDIHLIEHFSYSEWLASGGSLPMSQGKAIFYLLNLIFVNLILLFVWWKNFEWNFIFSSQMRFTSWSTKSTIRTEKSLNTYKTTFWKNDSVVPTRRSGERFLLEIINMFPRWIIFSIIIWVTS